MKAFINRKYFKYSEMIVLNDQRCPKLSSFYKIIINFNNAISKNTLWRYSRL